MKNVVIIYKENSTNEKHYTILQPVIGSPFKHLFPDQLFTLEEAKEICLKNNYNIKKLAHEWACFSKKFRLQCF